jgi:hypothetical protein
LEALSRLVEDGETTAISLSQPFMREDFARWTGGDDTRVQEDNPVEVLARALEVVVHDDSRPPLVSERPEHLENLLLGCGIHRRERLVHEIELCPLGKRAREKDSLLLPA